MPLKVVITANDDLVATVQIARIKGSGMSPDSVAQYSAVVTEDETWMIDWDNDGALFEHRYGDGVTTCVERGLAALRLKN